MGAAALPRSSARRGILSLVAATLLLAACASPSVTSTPTASPMPSGAPTAPPPSANPSSAEPTGSASPTAASSGLAFAAEDIVAYYESQGYACTAQQPSTKAVGFLFRGCRKVDEAGRARIIDVVTDPDGRLAGVTN